MSTVLNDRDAILQAATVRIVNPKNAWINLTASAPGFHLNAAGQVDLAKVTVTADLVGLDDAVTFTAVGGTLSNAVGRSVDVTYGGQTAIVTAKVVSNGDEFQRALIIPVLRDGASGTGTPGARGAGHYYGSGTAWTDALANITVPTTKVVGDVVTISGGTFVMEKRWTGSAWVENGVVVDGKLIVPLSILAGSIDTSNLDIKDANGNITFRANATMAEQGQINPNLVENFRSWVNTGSSVIYDPSAAINGEAMLLPPNTFTQSRVLGLEPNVDYIVSFRALSQQANTALSVDLFPDNLPEFTTGPLTAANKYFQFNMRSSASQMAAATLRFLGSPNGHILISDVKLERGSKATAWCDSVITPANASTFILSAAIKLAMIDKASIGQLSALVAYLGNVELGPLGALRQRAAAFGQEGIYLGADANGNPVFSLVKGDRKILFDASSSNPLQITNPDVQQAQMYITGAGNINGGSGKPNSTTVYYIYGSFEPTFFNAKEPVEVSYSFSVNEGNMRWSTYRNAQNVLCATVSGMGYNSSNSGTLVCTAIGADNRTATKNIGCFGSHGTLP